MPGFWRRIKNLFWTPKETPKQHRRKTLYVPPGQVPRNSKGQLIISDDYPWGKMYANKKLPRWMVWDPDKPEYVLANWDYIFPIVLKRISATAHLDDPYWHAVIQYALKQYILTKIMISPKDWQRPRAAIVNRVKYLPAEQGYQPTQEELRKWWPTIQGLLANDDKP